MYVITYKGKPVTLKQIHKIEYPNDAPRLREDDNRYLAFRTKKECIVTFLYHFGFSWKERTEGIECLKAREYLFSAL